MSKTRSRRGGFLGSAVNQAIVPLAILGLQQTYGKSKKGGKTHKIRGGFLAEAINQAVVPVALLGMQHTYGRKRKGGKTRKHH